MFFHAKNGKINETAYIRFGRGSRTLIMLPGLGEGLRTVQGTVLPMAWLYRLFAENFTVYMFSRRDDLPLHHTTRDMARDLRDAMDALGIGKADILGVSMGGMIAQWLAADYPEKVGKLILTVTAARPNPILKDAVGTWKALAEAGDHTALMGDNLRRIYSRGYCRKNEWMVPILGVLTKPKSYARFLTQAAACLRHDCFDCLNEIQAPTLVIGGEQDKTLGPDASRELAAAIPNAALKIYPQWGHGLYEEAKDFNDIVLDFLLK